MNLEPMPLLLVLLWGTLVGLDLVSVPQAMFSHPLVAAAVAGWIAGDVTAGLTAGAVLELYALETLPVGASRYPDFGVPAAAAGYLAVSASAALQPAFAVLVGIPAALLGEWSLHALRRRNAISIQRRIERVAAGDSQAITELQRNGLIRDAGRSFALMIASLIFGTIILLLPMADLPHAQWLSVAAVAGGLAAALGGCVRATGGGRRSWLLTGLAVGLLVAFLG